MQYRIEHDSMGEVKVPADKYWGAQTQRSIQNFPIGVGYETMPKEIIHAFGILKKAAAQANFQLRPEKMTEEKKNAICAACDEVVSGTLQAHFPLVVWQTGSGTQSNMNANEVIAGRGNEIAGKKLLHPNDDINMSQSSNDTFPTAMHIAAVCAVEDRVIPAIDVLTAAFARLEEEHAGIVKSGRTHLQDATPIAFSQEISGWRTSLERDKELLQLSLKPLKELALGGTAIALLVVFGYEVSEYLLRYSPKVLVPFVAIAGYGACLIFVGFCFACAAQLKTPDYYWWRNSITGRCCKLLGKLWHLFLRVCSWIWQHIPLWVRWCLLTAKKIILWAWNLVIAIWMFLWRLVKRCCLWCGRKLARLYSLLPLIWQWLLVGCIMLLMMAMIFAANGEELLVVLCLGASVGIILYGAHAFGILMEGARRMGKGDLETKVSDQFLLGSFKDFSKDLNALADVAMVAAQKQMKSERMKTELITNVSHDIKTPLTSIINYVDLLQKPHTEDEQEIYLEVLSRQSQQLKKLIEDLMEMSKASTGNMNVDITSVNAAEAINQALGEFSDKLERAQLTPVFRQPETPVYMLADGRLAWRVMSNLLSNAVKYALPGTRVYIDLMELEGKVIISMKNISREELNVNADELLERFVRGDASRNTEGSGLGLNIAQSLMEIQKGQLQLLVDGDLFKVTLVFPAATI